MKKFIAKWYIKLILILLFLSILGVIGKVILFPAKVAHTVVDSTQKTTTGVIEKTMNADNALFNYEEFHDLYNGAKQMKQNVDNSEASIEELKEMYGEPKTWSEDIRNEYNFTKETLDGYLMQYQRITSDYNSNSSKLNRNLFKDKNLPYELPLSIEELN